MTKKVIFILLTLTPSSNFFTQTMVNKSNNKIVIAHRGASGYLPEHTLESKAMSYAMHPDFIEQDLVLSKDDIPIVIHDIYLDDITDVAEKYPKRSREDNRYYVIDFTYQELLQLKVLERFNPRTKKAIFPNRFPLGKSRFNLHSLQDEIELIQGLNKSTGFNIGIYPEIKNPSFHQLNGKDISKIVLEILTTYGYTEKSNNCILQCFDSSELIRVRNEFNSNLFLVQLLENKEEHNFSLKKIARYADGIGPSLSQLIRGKDSDGNWVFSSIVDEAHENGLKVHAYTFRMDELGPFSSFDHLLEIGFNRLNLDGIFTDFPDKAILFLDKN